jgi:pimeloyl-ACP methyl ester carboxylesterase
MSTPTLPDRPARRLRARSGVLAVTLIAVLAIVGAACRPLPGGGNPAPKPLPTVVLVHGAFADASGWDGVIQRLQSKGYKVIAPANPLRSLAGDAAYVRSVIDTIEGPVVLVGHSYGGMVMTNAATGAANVEALVYIASFAPDVDDSVGSLSEMNPGSGVKIENLIIRPTGAGADGYINPSVFRSVFAADLPKATAASMAASQRPADLALLGEHSAAPAWAEIPSWYLVARQDNVIPPATQRFMAQRAGATTVEIDSSHVAMISHPKETTQLIIAAADTVG